MTIDQATAVNEQSISIMSQFAPQFVYLIILSNPNEWFGD